jgi:hypothetical protein
VHAAVWAPGSALTRPFGTVGLDLGQGIDHMREGRLVLARDINRRASRMSNDTIGRAHRHTFHHLVETSMLACCVLGKSRRVANPRIGRREFACLSLAAAATVVTSCTRSRATPGGSRTTSMRTRAKPMARSGTGLPKSVACLLDRQNLPTPNSSLAMMSS